MKTGILLAAMASLLPVSALAQAAPVTDCPMRDMPFSVQSPLIDILLNSAAREALEAALATDFSAMPPIVASTNPPSFASILTVREALGWGGLSLELLPLADVALRQIPVNDADRVARCARYDNNLPQFDLPGDGPTILLFEKINGFRDGPSVDAAHAAIMEIAQRKGWQMVSTESGGAINAETLAQFDAIIWNNISGDVLTLSQRQALRDFVEGGGGFVAVHGSAGDPIYYWDWYVDTLIGARFAGHPRDPQFQDARVVVEGTDHPAVADVPAEWVMRDEWYSFQNNPRDSGSRIIARLDESSYLPTAGRPDMVPMGEDHPIAWSRIVGKGRMFYSAIGHLPETYSNANYVAMIEDAVAWAARIAGGPAED